MPLTDAQVRKQVPSALTDRCHVHGVPGTVINETIHVEGEVPEAALMPALMAALEGHGACLSDPASDTSRQARAFSTGAA